LKEEGTSLYKKNEYQKSIDKFTQCLALDEHNLMYNATCHLNIALGLIKLKKYEEALGHLNKGIALNPNYAKALFKRGEVNQKLEN
jgi:tetratricopeptide (TPR) repeat protein